MVSERWLNILKWTTWPHFDHIHDMNSRDFEANYYISPSLAEVIDNLYSCLLTGRSISDKLLIGMPGCGKTTFIYYLMRVPHVRHKHALTERYHFEVFHINRVVSSSIQESEAAAIDMCLGIYRRYFVACGLSDQFNVINTNTHLANRDKINRCLDNIVRDKAAFQKKLIIVIDDIDEADERIVDPMLRFLYAFMEPVSIQKWLAVRETTIGTYKKEFLRFIRTKFPDKIPFPRVDFHGIVSRRIVAANPSGKNPFSLPICSELVAAYNYDLREAMGVVSKFFEINAPGDASGSVSEQWIERFFAVAFTKTLTQQKVFPNIYLRPRSSQYPLEKDIFLLLGVKHTLDKHFAAILGKYYSETISALRTSRDLYGSAVVTVTEEEIRGVVEFLVNNELVERNAEDCFYPSPKGRVFLRLLTEPYYNEICRAAAKADAGVHQPMFWELVGMNPDFSRTIL